MLREVRRASACTIEDHPIAGERFTAGMGLDPEDGWTLLDARGMPIGIGAIRRALAELRRLGYARTFYVELLGWNSWIGDYDPGLRSKHARWFATAKGEAMHNGPEDPSGRLRQMVASRRIGILVREAVMERVETTRRARAAALEQLDAAR